MNIKAFFIHLWIQFKMDLRERNTLLVFYLVPLVFYFVMGAVFSSTNPASKQTLSASMIIFAITMGSAIGMPAPLVKLRESGVLRSWRVCGIPGRAVILTQALSALLHLFIVSMIIFLTAPVFYGAGHPKTLTGFFGPLFILLFVNIGIGLLIGIAAKSQAAAVMFSQAVFLPTVMLGGIMFPASMLPKVLQIVGYVLPANYAMQAFCGMGFGMEMGMNGFLALIVPLGIGLLVFGLVAMRFQRIEKTL